MGGPVARAEPSGPAGQVGGEVIHVIHRCSLGMGPTPIHGVIAMGSTIGKPGGRLLSEGDESGVGQKRPAGCGPAYGPIATRAADIELRPIGAVLQRHA